ncbi:MAG: RNA polymerase-binding protein DksA [Alphaproteobacteria bacterium]
MSVRIPEGYKPSEEEEFMNPVMSEYFKQLLLSWKRDLLSRTEETVQTMQKDAHLHMPDDIDRASDERDWSIELRTKDRTRKLVHKIELALQRVDEGTYGYCKETDEPIGIRRLEARPVAEYSLEAQERHEREEKLHRDQ